MTLQASGLIKLSDIRAEFGGSAPDSLSEYYRGGSYVATTAANSDVPTSGIIKLSDFYGASAYTAPVVTLSDKTVSLTSFSNAVTAIYRLVSNGSVSPSGTWLTPPDEAPDDYQCRATSAYGSYTYSSGFGTWLALSTTRTWSVRAAPGYSNTVTAEFVIEIRKGTGAVLDSATINLASTVEGLE